MSNELSHVKTAAEAEQLHRLSRFIGSGNRGLLLQLFFCYGQDDENSRRRCSSGGKTRRAAVDNYGSNLLK